MKKYIVNVNGTKYEITLETVEGAEAQAAPAPATGPDGFMDIPEGEQQELPFN